MVMGPLTRQVPQHICERWSYLNLVNIVFLLALVEVIIMLRGKLSSVCLHFDRTTIDLIGTALPREQFMPCTRKIFSLALYWYALL